MKKKKHDDPRMAKAIWRFEILSPYLALKPRRGLKRKLLEKLAAQKYENLDGKQIRVSAETLRAWARRYRRGGLQGLMDKERGPQKTRVLSDEEQNLVCALKRQVPERSLERVIAIAEMSQEVAPGKLRRSTVHRILQKNGLSKPKLKTPDAQDLDRFEADAPNDLWQSDMLKGPWLPDPDNPDGVRRANLYLFMDDHSRMILHGRFSFSEKLPRMELVFRRALQKHAVPKRAYFDNGKVYRAKHIKQLAAELNIYRVIFTQPYRPMGHGKIEALNRLIVMAFIAEVSASNITTIDELNEAFVAWAELEYNTRIHGETGETPKVRWERGVETFRFVEEEKLRQAFLWSETRTADKTGVFGLFGTRYQVGPGLGKRKLQIRYDIDALDEVEVWQDGQFVQRAKPLNITAHRRPKQSEKTDEANPAAEKSGFDYLGHLVKTRRANSCVEPTPITLANQAKQRREQNTQQVMTLLDSRLAPGVVASDEVRGFMAQYGPLDCDSMELALDEMLLSGTPKDLHVSFYLTAIRDAIKGGLQ